MSVVSVLTLNGRRQNVKVTQNMRILQIIEEVCLKHELNPEEFDLKHQRTLLDVGVSFRYSGLPNNAKLELVKSAKPRSEAATQLALQLESGERLLHSFQPSQSLWDVLLYWDGQRDLLSTSSPPGQGHVPVCLYTRQEVAGEDLLKNTTLRSLGLTGGKAAIRLLFRPKSDSADSGLTQGARPNTAANTAAKELHHTSQQQPEGMAGLKVTTAAACSSPDSDGRQRTSPSSSPPQASPLPALTGQIDTGPTTSTFTTSTTSQKQDSTRSQRQDSPNDWLETAQGGGGSPWTTSTGAVFSSPFSGLYLGPSQPPPQQQTGHGLRGPPQTTSSQQLIQIPQELANFKFPEEREPEEASSISGQIDLEAEPCQRELVVYSLDTGQRADGDILEDLPDQFFEVTVDDVRRRLQDLQNVRNSFDQQQLMTESMRRQEKLRKISKYSKVVIRIQFPDRTILQGFFKPGEKVSALMEYVKDNLREPKEKFYLYTTPPRTTLKNAANLSLFDANLVPTALVHFGSESPNKDRHYLLPEHISGLSTLEKADAKLAHTRFKKTGGNTALEDRTGEEVAPSTEGAAASQSKGNTAPSAKRPRPTLSPSTPKWFKLGKK